jgi:predicted Fe-Mo cluster-binding NifX family protein
MKKICIPTNDRETIAQRTGRTKEFVCYEVEDGKIVKKYFIENPHHEHDHDDGEEGEHHHNEIIEILDGVDVFVVKAVGKFLRQDLIDAKVNFVRTNKEKLDDIIKEYL